MDVVLGRGVGLAPRYMAIEFIYQTITKNLKILITIWHKGSAGSTLRCKYHPQN